MTSMTPGTAEFLLAFADDEHLMGQQHTEWIGIAPFLEEDMAFASIAQDELSHAALLYAIVADNGQGGPPDDRAIDTLAFDRSAADYRSAQIVEVACTGWAHALVRHWLYDTAEELRWSLVDGSSLEPLRDAAAHAAREERFHVRHADGLIDVLAHTPDSADRLADAVNALLPLATGLFEPVAGEAEAIEAGVTSAPFDTMLPEWTDRVRARFPEIDIGSIAAPAYAGRAQRHGDFAALMARMNEVRGIDPTAVW
ncbi:MAG: phenylacetate-CoA oxygenase subunit PaaC [Acidimicrobiales bacterium]|nr:phenylacetate-CoA oxygenase subunit PaaI [Actinomycetota bacterium]MDP7209573.1 phenylacetate-CoA oxygenase subunit PaaC [Acidimicrobiales bacterium]